MSFIPRKSALLLKVIIIVMCIFICSNTYPQMNYTFNDLEILAKEQNFKEFVDHALDIRPSERTDKWSKMYIEMSILYIADKMKSKQYSATNYKSIQSLADHPILKANEIFKNKYENYMTEYFSNCLKDSDSKNLAQCKIRLKLFWNDLTGSINQAEIGIKIAKILPSSSPHETWSFLLPATTGSLSEFLCKRTMVKENLKNQILQYMIQLPTYKDLKKELKSLANNACYQHLYPILKNDLTNADKTVATMAFMTLKLENQLDEIEINTFLLSYILNGPIVGEIFNEAWKAVEDLGSNYSLRTKVLKKISSYDYIPDELFNMANKKKRDILIDLIDKNIPEYIDIYAKTCLDYLEGKVPFPQGNPTKHCRTMFKLSKNKAWPALGLKNRYRAIPNL